MWSSPLVSGGHEIVARMWQFPQLSCPSLPTRAGLMNMVIMGNHSINGARSNFLWFSPRYPPPLLPIWFNLTLSSKWISESSQIISQPRKNSSTTPLVCEGGLYGGRCPPLVRRCPSVRTPHLLTTTMGFLFAQWQSLTPANHGQLFSCISPSLAK